MTDASLVECPCVTAGRPVVIGRRRPFLPLDTICLLCGKNVNLLDGHLFPRRVAPDLAAAYRVGGVAAVMALVGGHPDDWPAVVVRIGGAWAE